MIAEDIQKQLEAVSSPQKRDFIPSFFKTGKGEYGEGDKFIGVVVPEIRKIAKQYKDLSQEEITNLLHNQYHECRLCALIILTERFKKAKIEVERTSFFNFYLQNTKWINNWDLVDLSCKDVIGGYLIDKTDRTILYKLAKSNLLWDQRIAIISTHPFIKKQDYHDTIQLSAYFLTHKHDLIHKAVGWMLREIGKQDKTVLTMFLDTYYKQMPRTMLRYSIEKLLPEEKAYYMKKV
ncbi:MAG: hypothetical protein RL662_1655 [Bacteroidota bacterium]|jgi:3-methyladenine DNA glycosylase AlkD